MHNYIKTTGTLLGLTAMLFVTSVLTGCGKNEKVDAGMQLIKELDYQGALAEFEQAREAGENERLTERGIGIAYMGLTRYEDAIEAFEKALMAGDGLVRELDYDLNYYLASAYVKTESYAEALDVYNSIIALKPDEDVYFLRANVLLELSRYDEAREDFDRVVSMDPTNYDRILEIYQALDHFGYREDGIQYLGNALDKYSDKMSGTELGRIYYYLGEYTQAQVILEKVRDKGDVETFLYLGKSYEATGDYNYARSVYNNYISQNGADARIYNQLGLCEITIRDYNSALSSFENGLALQDVSMQQTLSFNQIVAYEYMGDFDTAYTMIQQYLQNYPDDEKAIREQQFLSSR